MQPGHFLHAPRSRRRRTKNRRHAHRVLPPTTDCSAHREATNPPRRPLIKNCLGGNEAVLKTFRFVTLALKERSHASAACLATNDMMV